MRLAAAFLVAALVTGLGWLAALPPWEGFDETAHYAYIQELADTGHIPVFGESRISTDVDDYRKVLPSSYGTLPPFEKNGAVTYLDFFRAVPGTASAAALVAPRRFAPGNEANWAAQHPPLYYALLAPVQAATRDWSWPNQLLVMRAISYCLAVAGLALGVYGAYRYRGADDPGTFAAIVAAWPFLVPMFFSDMARLGNDSLCLLIAGGLWWQLLRLADRGDKRVADFAWVGVLLGLGLLTKAFFIPITAGVALYLGLGRHWRGAIVAMAVAALIGGPWYVYKYLAFGVATGALEHLQLAERGGLLANLPAQFSIAKFVRGLAGALATFAWGGTWSLARLPEAFLAPLLALIVLPFGAYLATLVRARPGNVLWAPFLMVGLVAAGLAHHVLLRIALYGEGRGTPGWYLHLLAGPLAFAFAVGVVRLAPATWTRRLLALLAGYTLLYFAIVSWLQLAMYAGCAAKIGDARHYAFPDGANCLVNAGRIYDHVAMIAHPGLAFPLLFGGIAAGAFLLTRLFRRLARGAGVSLQAR